MRRGSVTEHIHNTGYGYELISIACIFRDVGKYPRDKYPRGCFPLLCGGVKMIYLDNGATSFPKPPEVTEAIVTLAVTDYCANPEQQQGMRWQPGQPKECSGQGIP